jgi:hypothetical protein
MKAMLLALLFGAIAVNGQEVIETWDGSYRTFKDDHGRYVRLESSDGIVLRYLYDSPAATAETGVAVRVSEKVTLTVRYNDRGDFWAPGLPKISRVPDSNERTLEIRAGDKPIATFAYRSDKYIAGVSLPGHLSMRLTPPDARHRVRQTLQSGAGTVIGTADVVSSAGVVGMWSGSTFDTVAGSLGFNPRSLIFTNSPVGYLTTARDHKGQVALYIVSAGGQSVGFTPNGVARYYDLTADIFDSEIPAGSDLGVSVSLDQNKAAPEHITLTADGTLGMYVEEPADGAIYAAWVEPGEVIRYSRATAEKIARASR